MVTSCVFSNALCDALSCLCLFFHPHRSRQLPGVGVKDGQEGRRGSFFPDQGRDAGHSLCHGKQSSKLTDLLTMLAMHSSFSFFSRLFFFTGLFLSPVSLSFSTPTLDSAFPVLFGPFTDLHKTSCCYIACDPRDLFSPSPFFLFLLLLTFTTERGSACPSVTTVTPALYGRIQSH